MRIQRSAARLLATLALLALPLAASGQAPAPPSQGTAQQARPPFRLDFEDMMLVVVQPRHIKLGIAGEQRNWKVAEYVHKELGETFERIKRLYPTVDKKPISSMLEVMQEPMQALDKAIKDENSNEFTAAYQQLTAACNSCHVGAGGGEIVIKAPTPAMFADQDFAPAQKK